MAEPDAVVGLSVGELIPSFSACALDGGEIRRQQYKGRQHLVLLFMHVAACAGCRTLLAALAQDYDACRAEGAEVLAFVLADMSSGMYAPAVPFPVLTAPLALYERFGAHAADGAVRPALYLADRYGEVVWRVVADQSGDHALPVADVVPLVERMAMVCSL